MKKTIKAKWVKALRSGKYEKGKNMLRTPDNKFCCLGVLTDLYIKAHPECDGWQPNMDWQDKDKVNAYAYRNESGVTPRDVMEWAELTDSNPEVKLGNGHRRSLSQLNDGENTTARSFADIADFIEAQV